MALLVERALDVMKKAKKHRANLAGDNFYANKLAELRADATVCFRELSDPSVGDISAMAEMVEIVFSANSDRKRRIEVARELGFSLKTRPWRASQEGLTQSETEDGLFPLSLLTRTGKAYLIVVGRQMNGCVSKGWYDAGAVMLRRLVETCIIEAFEAYHIDAKIKNAAGDFLPLSELVQAALAEPAWNLSRNAKRSLPKLRDVGHISAHSRRFTAQRGDLDRDAARIVIEEFLHLAGLLRA